MKKETRWWKEITKKAGLRVFEVKGISGEVIGTASAKYNGYNWNIRFDNDVSVSVGTLDCIGEWLAKRSFLKEVNMKIVPSQCSSSIGFKELEQSCPICGSKLSLMIGSEHSKISHFLFGKDSVTLQTSISCSSYSCRFSYSTSEWFSSLTEQTPHDLKAKLRKLIEDCSRQNIPNKKGVLDIIGVIDIYVKDIGYSNRDDTKALVANLLKKAEQLLK